MSEAYVLPRSAPPRRRHPRNPQQQAIKFALTVARRWGVRTVVLRKDDVYRVHLEGIRWPGSALVGVTDAAGVFFVFVK
jgi:hypothetical protein